MKNYILNRYDKDDSGNLIIKIHTPKIEDLYEDYDKKSSFIKKDLKYKLEEYLFECVDEIGNIPFILQFHFEEKINLDSSNRLQTSINEYFSYLQFLEKKSMKESLKNSVIFFIVGFLLVFISFSLSENENLFYKIISEGFMIGGWVALWEALAIVLINWLPLNKNLKIYKKIANAKIEIFY
ncbi:hypothetical protein [Aliarcobacter cibarius]|jgi:hypothetical protein|nr:hypothetical protein [Aliarcobacter cibarius]QEZ88929.1 putative membrane protein [Aliarcobacter cibarius]QKJ26973.1 putative membrane protein [Aliarcobacter cibarius]TLT03051.1 hypothetical protein FE248_08345 [Aliarcobacter cibarius]